LFIIKLYKSVANSTNPKALVSYSNISDVVLKTGLGLKTIFLRSWSWPRQSWSWPWAVLRIWKMRL